jgi:predicted Zn-dependent protease
MKPGWRPYRHSLVWILVVALIAPACASSKLPPIGAGGAAFKPEPDERALWAKAEKEEQELRKKAKPYDDPLLEEYLAGIGERLLPDEVRAAGGPGFKFGVMSDPTLNAFAMPNGRIYFHTGLLARLDNEAQLATIVGHEMTHVTHRHSVRYARDAQNKQILYTLAAIGLSIGIAAAAGARARSGDPIGGAVISQTAQAVLGLGLQLATIAAITGYGRDLEREADVEGLDRLVKAGYDPKESPRVFEILKSESADRGKLETFFFGSHPRLQERIDSTKQLVGTKYASAASTSDAMRDTEDFHLRMRTVVRENAQLDIRAGRFDLAQGQLDRVLRLTPKDPTAHVYYGDLHRLRSQRAKSPEQKTDFAKRALESYERAAELDPKLPEPHRQLGLLYYQQKDPARAREAFEKYLALKPDAPDARRIREYIVELDR